MIKNTLLYIFSGAFTQFVVFVLWMLLPGFLTPADIGRYTNYLYYVDFFSAFVIVGGDSILVRYYYSTYEKKDVLSQVVLTTFGASILLYILLLLNSWFNWFNFQFTSIWWLHLLPVIIVLNAAANLCLTHYSANRQANTYTRIQFAKTIIFVAAALVLSYLKFSSEGLILALVLSCFMTVVYFIRSESFSITSFKLKKEPLVYGLPLMFYNIVSVVSLYASRIFLQHSLGLVYTGIFSFFLVIVYQFNGLYSSFNKAWTPEVYAKLSKDSSTEFLDNSAFGLVFVYLFLLFIGTAAGNLFLFKILFRQEYLPYIHVFLILLTFPIFAGIYTVYYPLFYLENKTKSILVISIINTCVNILLLYFFIKTMGMNGAAIGTVLNSMCGLFIYLVYFRKVVKLSSRSKIWLVIITSGTILSVAFLILMPGLLGFYMVQTSLLIITLKMGSLNKMGKELISPILVKIGYRPQS